MKIPTKELYLCRLAKVKKVTGFRRTGMIDYEWHTESEDYGLILARKSHDGYNYVDIFTGTIYQEFPYAQTEIKGTIFIHGKNPLMTNKKYITEEEASLLFERLNPKIIIHERPSLLSRVLKRKNKNSEDK